MGRKAIFVLLLGLTFASVRLADAQQHAKVSKLGFLGSEYLPENIETLRQGLRDLGYVEGQNLIIGFRYAEGKIERLPELADELVRLKVDVIVVTGSTPGALAAKKASKTIPIVFLSVSNPSQQVWLTAYRGLGGNVTGLTNIHTELSGKRLELLKETIPKLSRVAVLWDPRGTGSALSWKETQLAARE